jgi:hypothetical protein
MFFFSNRVGWVASLALTILGTLLVVFLIGHFGASS